MIAEFLKIQLRILTKLNGFKKIYLRKKYISEISCSKEVFYKEASVYNDALPKAGYRSEVRFTESTATIKKKRSRTRNIIWFILKNPALPVEKRHPPATHECPQQISADSF